MHNKLENECAKIKFHCFRSVQYFSIMCALFFLVIAHKRVIKRKIKEWE